MANSSKNIKRKSKTGTNRGGAEGQELQWNCKRKQSEPLRKLFCRHFYDILSFDGYVSALVAVTFWKRCWIKINIPDPWILKEEEVLANNHCRDY